MDRPDAPVRWLTGSALPLDPAVLKSFVPALELCLSDPDTAVRLAAAQRLWDLNHKSEQVVPVLMGCVRDAAGDLQHRAFAILSAIGPEAKEALAAIKPLLGDSSDEIRIAAAQALWKIGRDTTGIKRLAAEFQKRVGSTDSSDVAFVGAAMSVLEDLDSGGQDTVPSLIEAAAATPAGDARRGQLINVVRSDRSKWKGGLPKIAGTVKGGKRRPPRPGVCGSVRIRSGYRGLDRRLRKSASTILIAGCKPRRRRPCACSATIPRPPRSSSTA